MAKDQPVLGDYTARELRLIELRTNGMKPEHIAMAMETTRNAVYSILHRVYAKSGTTNTAQLTRWAWECGLDAPAPPDTPETATVPEPKKRYQKIRLNRIRRLQFPRS